MRKKDKKVARYKYRVTCHCMDGSSPQVTVWAESPEHAKRKAVLKLSPDKVAVSFTAEEVEV